MTHISVESSSQTIDGGYPVYNRGMVEIIQPVKGHEQHRHALYALALMVLEMWL